MAQWQRNAVEDLKDYNANTQFIASMTERLAALNADLTRIKSALKGAEPVLGGTSTAEDSLISNIDERTRLAENLSIISSKLNAIEGALAILDDEERLILDRFFINRTGNHIDRLCDELCCEKTTVYRKKDEALRHFTKALYGIVEI